MTDMSRGPKRDVGLALALTGVGALLSSGVFFLLSSLLPLSGTRGIALVPALLIGAYLTVRLLAQSWQDAMYHSATRILVACLLGAGLVLVCFAWWDWPDLLSPQAYGEGQLLWYLEAAKPFLPWVPGSLVAWAVLRVQLGAAGRDYGVQP